MKNKLFFHNDTQEAADTLSLAEEQKQNKWILK